MQVTMAYVDARFTQFVQKYTEALKFLQFDASTVEKNAAALQHRLAAHDFKLYGAHPIHFLHGGKRITRFLIKLAIETCPATRARRERLRREYEQRITEARKSQPAASFFSFEAAYADKLKVKLAPMSHLFRI